MNTNSKTKKSRPPFAVEVAHRAVEEALKLTAKNASQRFVALLIPPREADADIYEEAALRYLRGFLNSLPGDTRPCLVEVAKKSPSDRLVTYADFGHLVLIVPDPETVNADARLMADRVVMLRLPEADDFCASAKVTYDTSLPRTSAEFLADIPLRTIALAFPKGRPYSSAMRKVRTYARAAFQVKTTTDATSTKVPRNARTLHQLPGYGEAKTWGLRLASDLEEWKAGRIDWSDVDKGAVLMGPPGVGKTVFARALANTCEVPLIHTSAATWQSHGHLGDTLKAMKKSFADARTQSPAVLFIDELDSLPNRDHYHGDNANYVQQFVNGFLECLDGIEGRDGVVVVSATNRIQDVDPAMLRAGRLERVIHIPLPDTQARNEILRMNLPGLEPEQSLHFDLSTVGWSGADVEQLARDVSRVCRVGHRSLSWDVVSSVLPELVPLDEDFHYRLALHEAGHALYANLFHLREVRWVAVNPFEPTRLNPGGGSVVLAPAPALPHTESWYREHIGIALAGLAAERLAYGDHGDGSGGTQESDLAQATHLATCMVAAYGMGGMWSSEASTDPKAMAALRKRDRRVRRKVEEIIATEFHKADEGLAANEYALRDLAQAVMERGALDGREVDELIAAHRCTSILPPAAGGSQR